MTTVIYEPLSLHPEHIPVIAQWHQNEWHNISPDLNTDARIQLYSSYQRFSTIPSCILALINNKPAGSASLVVSDMDSYPQLSPWLASVFVHSDFRNQGIASQLLDHCLDAARQADIKILYLFTPDKTDFYRKRGWDIYESTIYHGENVDIMSYDLCKHFKTKYPLINLKS